jgi:N-acetylmuramoyl-L-alanine amidase
MEEVQERTSVQDESVNRKKKAARTERPVRINALAQLSRVLVIGALLATMFTAWTPLGLIPAEWAEKMARALEFEEQDEQESISLYNPALTPTQRPKPRIGIVAGHWDSDTGAICPDGLTEQEVNLTIASLVQKYLTAEGYDVDLLREFDPLLEQYHALALVSIHADSCEFIDNETTGFKVTSALGSSRPQRADRLVACIQSRYAAATGLKFHAGSITEDMTSYHAFDEIHNETAAAIIETGFLNLDRQLLTGNPELVAHGIADGILCYIHNESLTLPTPTPAP